jgi:hypothetical protein
MVIVMTVCCSLFLYVLRAPITYEKSLASVKNHWQAISKVRTVMSQLVYGKKRYPFVLEPSSGQRSERLIFAFNNGVDPSPKLSNEVLAMLFVEKGKGLILTIRSAPERAVIGQEEECSSVIWPEAENISFEFLPGTAAKGFESQPLSWQTEWKQEELPTCIRLTITQSGGGTAVITCLTQPKLGEICIRS